jgi:GR25 family glycosyltransferase involved in LPS biosynthesis
MNNPVSSFFQKIVCINLDRRTDRWVECQVEFEKLGFQAERISAVAHPHGPYGCSLSHLQAIRKHAHLENLFVLEDDFTAKGDMSHVASALSALPENWEVVYLGGLVFPDEIYTAKVADHLHYAKNVVCCHAYGLSQRGMKRMISEFGAMVGAGSRTPIDEYLRGEVQPSGTAFIVTPMVFDQRPSLSDTTGQPASAHNLFSITNNKFK